MGTHLKFWKMHGLGNDFVLADMDSCADHDLSLLARKLCDRRRGIGSDGLLLIDPTSSPYHVRMFNPDGSESEMCGNGVRCLCLWLMRHEVLSAPHIELDFAGKRLTCEVLSTQMVKVDMGQCFQDAALIGLKSPHLNPSEIEIIVNGQKFIGVGVSVGNPHWVCFVEDVDAIDVATIGPLIEHHELFANGVNCHFAALAGANIIRQRTWERGAGETQACGSGACSVAFAAKKLGLSQSPTTVRLDGGDLLIEITDDDRALMTGPAAFVFEGTIQL